MERRGGGGGGGGRRLPFEFHSGSESLIIDGKIMVKDLECPAKS